MSVIYKSALLSQEILTAAVLVFVSVPGAGIWQHSPAGQPADTKTWPDRIHPGAAAAGAESADWTTACVWLANIPALPTLFFLESSINEFRLASHLYANKESSRTNNSTHVVITGNVMWFHMLCCKERCLFSPDFISFLTLECLSLSKIFYYQTKTTRLKWKSSYQMFSFLNKEKNI